MSNTKQALPTCNTSGNPPPPTYEARFNLTLPTVVFINLTLTTFTTMYRAHQHQDIALVAFIAFVYASYFILSICVEVYSRLPKGENSTKKQVLRFTLWFLPTVVLLGFAVEFGTFMPMSVVVLMYCLAVVSSFLLFYVHYMSISMMIKRDMVLLIRRVTTRVKKFRLHRIWSENLKYMEIRGIDPRTSRMLSLPRK